MCRQCAEKIAADLRQIFLQDRKQGFLQRLLFVCREAGNVAADFRRSLQVRKSLFLQGAQCCGGFCLEGHANAIGADACNLHAYLILIPASASDGEIDLDLMIQSVNNVAIER